MTPKQNVADRPHIWFLRKNLRRIQGQEDQGRFGIVDPEDLQSLDLRHYFMGYLSDDPEAILRNVVKKRPELADRAKSYLDHCAVLRAMEIKDPRARVAQLTPFFLTDTQWQMKSEAVDGIVEAGKAGGEKLLQIFDDPKHKRHRQSIMLLWRKMNYQPVGKMLIRLLEQHDEFWKQQDLEEDWWNAAGEVAEQRRQIYGEVYYAVCTLRKLKTPQPRAILELTRDRWRAFDFSNDQIVEE